MFSQSTLPLIGRGIIHVNGLIAVHYVTTLFFLVERYTNHQQAVLTISDLSASVSRGLSRPECAQCKLWP